MKKFFSFIVVLMFIGTGFAQHTNTVTQTGPENLSTVTQSQVSGYVGGNVATVNQFDGKNESVLTQIGVNTAVVNQTRVGTADGNYSSLIQDAWYNVANIDQVGSDNTSTALQYHGWVHHLDVEQTGASNESDVYQFGWNTANVIQTGNENTSDIDQLGGGIIANMTQIGDHNDGTIYQADIYYNKANVVVYGDDNITLVEQRGNSNEAFQYIGTNPSPVGNNNHTTLFQTGDLNYSMQNQQGSLNISTVTQTGNSNTSYSYQN